MPRGRQPAFPWTPCAGVKNDFSKVLKLFAESNTVRYEQFAEIWRDLKMPFIFMGRDSERELREFTEDILRMAVELWLPPASFQNRVGAMYLLYGLYFKQLSEPRCKIRVTLDMWQEVLLFMAEVKRQQHLDVEFCFHKLCYHRAFHYVANASEQIHTRENPSVEETKTEDELEKLKRVALVEQKSLLSEILEPESIDQLSAIHEQYHQMKCALSGSSVPDRSLNVIEANLVQHITRSVTTFEDWRKKKASGQKTGRRRKDSGASGTSESDGESHSEGEMITPRKAKSPGQRRAEIRSRAFAAATTKGRRHRHIGKDISKTTESPMASTPKRKKNDTKDTTDNSAAVTGIKTEFADSVVMDMPIIGEMVSTPDCNKRRRKGKSPVAAKPKKGSETPVKSQTLKVQKGKKSKSLKEVT